MRETSICQDDILLELWNMLMILYQDTRSRSARVYDHGLAWANQNKNLTSTWLF
jgi:hypothetical protein